MRVLAVLVATAVWLYGCFQFIQYFPGACAIGDWSKTTSAIVLAAVATSGWMVVAGLGLWGIGWIGNHRSLPKVAILSDKVGTRLTSSAVTRIFCSQSESYRGFVHGRVNALKQGAIIKVLVRTDSTINRDDKLRLVADKWRSDIAGRGVTVEVRAVEWTPLMFRGWLFDDKAGVLGWYNRVNTRTTGQGDDTFLITDRDMLRGLATTFDEIFNRGIQL